MHPRAWQWGLGTVVSNPSRPLTVEPGSAILPQMTETQSLSWHCSDFQAGVLDSRNETTGNGLVPGQELDVSREERGVPERPWALGLHTPTFLHRATKV